TGVKPHWLVALLPALWADKRLIVPFFGACIGLLAFPYLILGPGAILDYVHLITARGSGDLTDSDYSTALLSWAGFFRAFTGQPQPLLWLIASISTLVAVVLISWRADVPVALAGGV